jgi:integrase
MPLYLRPPRAGKTPNFEIRGSHLGVSVETSARTSDERLARKQLGDLEAAIERGEYPPAEPVRRADAPTFLTAAVGYMESGGERRYVGPLLDHFGETPLDAIDQAAIDEAARKLRPRGAPDYRNRTVYTPVSAILHHHYGDAMPFRIRRPKGAKGRIVTDYLTPADADAILAAAAAIDAELALLLRLLLYTGIRVGEALALDWQFVQLAERTARVRWSKNDDPRELRLRADLAADLERHRDGRDHGRVFRWRYGGRLKDLFLAAKLAACGLTLPPRPPKGTRGHRRRLPAYKYDWVTLHTLRHTWASWMRRYGGLDVQGLVATGHWRDPTSARRYAHAAAREEWSRVDRLPDVGRREAK